MRAPDLVRLRGPLVRSLVAVVVGAAHAACTLPSRPPVPDAAVASPHAALLDGDDGKPYVGLGLVDDDHGLRIARLFAGPAAAAGFAISDYLLDAEGAPLGVADFVARVAAAAPGDVFRIVRERDGEQLARELVIDHRGAWIGPGQQPRARRTDPALAMPASPSWFASRTTRPAAVPAIAALSGDLEAMLAGVAAVATGYNRSPWADRALADGAVLAAWPGAVQQTLTRGAASATPWYTRLCNWRAQACSTPAAPALEDLAGMAQALAALAAAVEAVFTPYPGGRGALLEDGQAWLAHTVAVPPGLPTRDDLRVMRASMVLDTARLLELFGALEQLAAVAPALAVASRAPGVARPAGVDGELLAVVATAFGAVVVGGPGPNRYAMDGLLAVIDRGGDDRYTWQGAARPLQLVLDLAGDDRYVAAAGGPGAGLLGIAVLRDLGGDDDYRSGLAGCGSALFGFALLDDRGGRDRYACGGWSQGAAIYGGAVLVDGGDAPDRYTAPAFAQGIGGPGGIGVLHDGGGDDVYRADGALPSVYGTPGVYFAMSQGVGYGPRPYEHGGLGLLLDDGGDDRYFAGEFAQGGGYYGGLGLLDDAAGDDRYAGHRYAQGFAVHQAAGVLRDRRGHDLYWATTAAAQGAAWDQARGLLIEADGDDQYRAGHLSQGAAAQQATALLYDAAGADVYQALAPAQGGAGPNEYHFDAAAPVCSLGLLEDRAGRDRYSSGLGDDGARLADAAGSGVAAGQVGLAVDGVPAAGALHALPVASCGPAR
ncbi:MAG: hypothetical protein H6977_20185 [Gammaproteobacteria bacterium]|nr:hypothetical protein [Gammaproteobacteria bacterium]MCP5202323.1 hypothetical protein [Gammaproteobacteria bacterium]